VNYIDLINSFWDLAMTNPLSTGQVSLYFALLHVCNRSYWTEWFQAPNQVLSVLTGLSRSGIQKARNELKQRGLIDFKERGTKATSYKLVIVNSNQVSVQDSNQISSQKGVQDSNQIGGTLYKTKDKRRDEDNVTPLIPPAQRFEHFLSAYPKDCNRYLTEIAYDDLLLTGKVTEDDLVECALNYSEWCRILGKQEKFIKNAENFLREFVFEKYLPGTYKKPKAEIKSDFNQFMQQNYDFEQIEKDILSN